MCITFKKDVNIKPSFGKEERKSNANCERQQVFIRLIFHSHHPVESTLTYLKLADIFALLCRSSEFKLRLHNVRTLSIHFLSLSYCRMRTVLLWTGQKDVVYHSLHIN